MGVKAIQPRSRPCAPAHQRPAHTTRSLIHTYVRRAKNYPDEFKGDAVALYRDTEGATITVIAAELGVSDATLAAWCKAAGVPIRHRRTASTVQTGAGAETAEQQLARLQAENRELRAEKTKLATERDILRSAAKYFAGATNW